MSSNVVENCLSITFLVNSILLRLTLINKEQHCLGEGGVLSLFFLEGAGGLLFSLGRGQGVSCCLCFAYIISGRWHTNQGEKVCNNVSLLKESKLLNL